MKPTLKILYLIIAVALSSCGGTINTTKYVNTIPPNVKTAYIIPPQNSKYIKFKFGTLTYPGYYMAAEDPAPVKEELIGDTAEVIKAELEKRGIKATIAQKGDEPDDFDIIVQYYDTWRWDFKKILDKLQIYFIAPTGDKILAKSTFTISENKETHNFPTPKKEVPKMIEEIFEKNQQAE